jgi:acyl carrier protein
MNDFVGPVPHRILSLQRRDGAPPGLGGQNSSAASRGIFGAAQRQKEHGAERDPHEVDRPEMPPAGARIHDSYNTGLMERSEIAETLVALVKKEKDIADDNLSPETVLADAGIDSLDSLTILFAIEEHFKISIPDTRAREIKTFGDMIDAVAELLPAGQ